MQAVGPDTAAVPEDYFESQREVQTPRVDMSNDFWNYRNKNTFRGVPVSQEARDLLVDNVQELNSALQFRSSNEVWVGYISPQEADKKYLEEYRKIKQKHNQGTAVIFSQEKQFCPALNKFLVLIEYGNIQMGLNPRYKHLQETPNE